MSFFFVAKEKFPLILFFKGDSFFMSKSKAINYDPKQNSIDAYIVARQTKSPTESLQAMKIFALSNFFTFTENLSHNENLNALEMRNILRRKIFEFANVLDLTEEQCERVKNDSSYRESAKVINFFSISFQ